MADNPKARGRRLVDPADPRDHRTLSADWLQGGFWGVCRAFNLTNGPNIPFSYDAVTVEAVKEHFRALLALQAAGALRPNPEPRMIPWADPRLRGALKEVRGNMALIEARESKPFRRFMESAQGEQGGPVGPLHNELGNARMSAAAKRAWARRKRPGPEQ